MPHRRNSLVLCVVWADVASGPMVYVDRGTKWCWSRWTPSAESHGLPFSIVCRIYRCVLGVSGNNLLWDA